MKDTSDFDVLIFGGGPAGISAGIWADELGLTAAIVDRGSALGGQLHNVFNPITNYPGAEFENGAVMCDALAKQMAHRSTKLMLRREVVAVDVAARKLTFADGESVSGRSLILATGVRRRKLNVPGEAEFLGKGILRSGAQDPRVVAGKTVAIIGGGDAALENAIILSAHASRVLLIHRRGQFSAREEFVSKVRGERKIEIIFDSEVVHFSGSEFIESVDIRNNITKKVEPLKVDHALIRIGFQPNSDLFRDQIDCDESGYVQVQQNGITTIHQVYAVGDLCSPFIQVISCAAGDAAAISTTIFNELS